MQQYDDETIVIKYGGHAMGAEELAKAFARDIVLLEQTAINPVVVHGGGPQIATMLKRLGIQSEFAAGLRITDAATIEIVEMVLAGSINKQLVGYINEAGGKAVGLCGKDGNMVMASKATRTMVDPDSHIERVVDLGFVGEPDKVDLTLLNQLIGYELIPVLAPLATSKTGQTFNVNADTFAGAVAGALKAKRLLLLTDVPGVLDKSKKLIPELSVKDARKLIADGTISGGMIPKVETCIYALEQGVQGVVIIDGKMPHAVLLELFTNAGHGHADTQVMTGAATRNREPSWPGLSLPCSRCSRCRRAGPCRLETLQSHELCGRGRDRHRRQGRHRDARLVSHRSRRLPRGGAGHADRRPHPAQRPRARRLRLLSDSAERRRHALRRACRFRDRRRPPVPRRTDACALYPDQPDPGRRRQSGGLSGRGQRI